MSDAAAGYDPLQDDLDALTGASPTQDARLEYDEPPAFLDYPPVDEDYANRLLRRRMLLLRTVSSVTALADKEVERVNAWKRRRTLSAIGEVDRIDGILSGFMRAVKERSNGKTKSLDLPNGRLGVRAPGKGRLVVADDVAFARWCVDNQRADDWWVQPPPKPALAVIGKTAVPGAVTSTDVDHPGVAFHAVIDKDSGEAVPGLRWEIDTQDRFYVKQDDAQLDDEAEGGEE